MDIDRKKLFQVVKEVLKEINIIETSDSTLKVLTKFLELEVKELLDECKNAPTEKVLEFRTTEKDFDFQQANKKRLVDIAAKVNSNSILPVRELSKLLENRLS